MWLLGMNNLKTLFAVIQCKSSRYHQEEKDVILKCDRTTDHLTAVYKHHWHALNQNKTCLAQYPIRLSDIRSGLIYDIRSGLNKMLCCFLETSPGDEPITSCTPPPIKILFLRDFSSSPHRFSDSTFHSTSKPLQHLRIFFISKIEMLKKIPMSST